MELKNFIDFIYSSINMDEVKDGIFPLPSEITFTLDKNKHIAIHKKIKQEKGESSLDNLGMDFDVVILGINLKFICKKED